MAKKRVGPRNPVVDMPKTSVPVIEHHWKTFGAASPNFLFWEESYTRHQAQGTGWHRHHRFYAVYLVRAGRANHIINGHSYALARGDVYMLPPSSLHYYAEDEGLELDAFHFRASIFRSGEMAALRSLSGLNALFLGDQQDYAANSENSYRLRLKTEYFEEAVAMVEKIREERQSGETGILIARQLFFQLMVQIARWNSDALPAERAPVTVQKNSPAITAILQYCEKHFHEGLQIERLAAQFFISPASFYRLFKAEVGLSPAAYIRRLRLLHAQKLLAGTTLPAYEIAQQCGFANTTQFSRAFKTAFRQTPSGYRLDSKTRIIR